jgi:hypothetical protein
MKANFKSPLLRPYFTLKIIKFNIETSWLEIDGELVFKFG